METVKYFKSVFHNVEDGYKIEEYGRAFVFPGTGIPYGIATWIMFDEHDDLNPLVQIYYHSYYDPSGAGDGKYQKATEAEWKAAHKRAIEIIKNL